MKEKSERLLQGLAIGEAIASGRAMIIRSVDEIDRFQDGSILVTGMTDPDHDEYCQSGCSFPMVAASLPEGGTGPHGIYHQ